MVVPCSDGSPGVMAAAEVPRKLTHRRQRIDRSLARPRSTGGRPRIIEETVRDVGHAVGELARAHAELVAIANLDNDSMHGVEVPLARVDLVLRFAQDVLRRHRGT